MKYSPSVILLTVSLLLFADGCTVTRPVRQTKSQNEFFSPVKARQRSSQQTAPTIDPSLALEVNKLRDSVEALTALMNTLYSRIEEIESYQGYVSGKQNSLEQQLAYAQSENRRLSQELSELRAKLLTHREVPKEISQFSTARHSVDLTFDYEGALSLFMERQYSRAIDSFRSLLNSNIPDDLVDNCEYWIGESYFAQKKYNEAIKCFEKVLGIPNSNKHADAYFMLGRTYEILRDSKKARWAFEELLNRFPMSERAPLAKQKLRRLQPNGVPPQNNPSAQKPIPTI
ncbi:MAG TPA: tetratricopeptide repeat protein [Bacteroidota bacterium]|nr:tetratricopeptide repeat protein [Bacteroidota bacterium]